MAVLRVLRGPAGHSWRTQGRSSPSLAPVGVRSGARCAYDAGTPWSRNAATQGRRWRRRDSSYRKLSQPARGGARTHRHSEPAAGVAVGLEGMCPGCGVPMQSHAPSGWGYTPGIAEGVVTGSLTAGLPAAETVADAEEPAQAPAEKTCQRCHRLQFYNDTGVMQMTTLQAKRELVTALSNRRCVVVSVVDLLDFHGSFVPDLHKLIGKRRPVLIAGAVLVASTFDFAYICSRSE